MVVLWKVPRRYGIDITRIEADRVTDKSYFYTWNGDERQARFSSEYEMVFKTWEEAHQFLIDRIESDRKRIVDNLAKLNGYMATLLRLEPDKPFINKKWEMG